MERLGDGFRAVTQKFKCWSFISCCRNMLHILYLRLHLEWLEFRRKSRSLVIAMSSTLKKTLLGNIHGHVLKSDAITKHNAEEVRALCYLKFLHRSKQWDLFRGKLFGALCWFRWWWESIWPVSRGVSMWLKQYCIPTVSHLSRTLHPTLLL